MLVSVQQKVDVVRQKAGGLMFVRKITERMMRERQPEATERIAVFIPSEKIDLVAGEAKLAGVIVVSCEPGRIETDYVYGEREIARLGAGSIAEPPVRAIFRQKSRPSKAFFNPAPECATPL